MKKSSSCKNKPIFCRFGYVDYIILASSVAIALGDELNSSDLNILSTFFAVLADELALISSVESSPSDENNTFVAPVPAISNASRKSPSSSFGKNRQNNNAKINKKKIIRKKIRKKKTLN